MSSLLLRQGLLHINTHMPRLFIAGVAWGTGDSVVTVSLTKYLRIKVTKKTLINIKTTDLLLIDEISMISSHVFEKIDYILRNYLVIYRLCSVEICISSHQSQILYMGIVGVSASTLPLSTNFMFLRSQRFTYNLINC